MATTKPAPQYSQCQRCRLPIKRLKDGTWIHHSSPKAQADHSPVVAPATGAAGR